MNSLQTRVLSHTIKLEQTPLEGGLKCTKCDRVKPADQFTPSRTTTRGYKYYCKQCSKIAGQEYERTPERKAMRREYVAKRRLARSNDPHWQAKVKSLGPTEAYKRYRASPITKLKLNKRKCEKMIARWTEALAATTRELERMLAERELHDA